MKGWKTLAFGALLAALGSLQQADWVSIIPDGYSGLVVGGIGLVVMWLRKLTTTPMGKPE